MQAYSDPKREGTYALPDVEVFYHDDNPQYAMTNESGERCEPGWYWWSCFPGCLPDGDPIGPFETEAKALADAQDGYDDDRE